MDKDYLLDLMVNVREKMKPVDEAVETICALADDDTGAEQCNLPFVSGMFSAEMLEKAYNDGVNDEQVDSGEFNIENYR